MYWFSAVIVSLFTYELVPPPETHVYVRSIPRIPRPLQNGLECGGIRIPPAGRAEAPTGTAREGDTFT